MLDTAIAKVPESPELVVAVETITCLPDAVQVLTSCTTGNGRMKVYDWGKFALTAYNRETMKGVRTWVIADVVPKWPLINDWFNPAQRIGESPLFEDLVEAFFEARSELIGVREVRIVSPDNVFPRKKTGICEKCGESYNLKCGPICSACQGQAYYTLEGGA
ncbi:FmdE family protein [Desulfosarcina cetonica]|uniref:FmdE family protein n=1 Tax=Desulfosarcina cetonica TaxID=90730 RepID=UPI0006D14B8F|nr:FmdE family protein [Desulfosarcina cetonica]